jgi:hypothetical protein
MWTVPLGLASNSNPLDFCFLRSLGYRHEPPAHFGNLAVSNKIKHTPIPFHTPVPFLGIYPWERELFINKKTRIEVVIAVLVTRATNWKNNLKCPLTQEWTNSAFDPYPTAHLIPWGVQSLSSWLTLSHLPALCPQVCFALLINDSPLSSCNFWLFVACGTES